MTPDHQAYEAIRNLRAIAASHEDKPIDMRAAVYQVLADHGPSLTPDDAFDLGTLYGLSAMGAAGDTISFYLDDMLEG